MTSIRKKLNEDKADAKNLENIKEVIKQAGFKTPRTVELLAKDILDDLKNNYDKDTQMDNEFLQPVIVDALSKRIQKITGKTPQMEFGVKKQIEALKENNKMNGNWVKINKDLKWDEITGDYVGTGLAQLANAEEAEDQSGEPVFSNEIKEKLKTYGNKIVRVSNKTRGAGENWLDTDEIVIEPLNENKKIIEGIIVDEDELEDCFIEDFVTTKFVMYCDDLDNGIVEKCYIDEFIDQVFQDFEQTNSRSSGDYGNNEEKATIEQLVNRENQLHPGYFLESDELEESKKVKKEDFNDDILPNRDNILNNDDILLNDDSDFIDNYEELLSDEELYTPEAAKVYETIQVNLTDEDRKNIYKQETGDDIIEDMDTFWNWLEELDSDDLERLAQTYPFIIGEYEEVESDELEESKLVESDATEDFLTDLKNLLNKHCRITPITSMTLSDDGETVIIDDESYKGRKVSIAADSNLAAIEDIVHSFK